MHDHISSVVADSLEVERRYFVKDAESMVRAAAMIAACFDIRRLFV